MDSILVNFAQNNFIVKTGKELVESGQLDLTNLGDTPVSVECYIGKKKRTLSQEVEGNVSSFQSYVMARPDVTPLIATHDLVVTERGEVFIVGPVSQRNNGTTINSELDSATYLYAELEIFEDA